MTIEIDFNGKAITVPDGETLASLLAGMKINSVNAIVELNGAIIPPQKRDSCRLCAGDKLQVFAMVGGG